MASNAGSVTDPADGRSDDWIELFNPTATPVLLAGWRLSDLAPSPTEFVFPSGFALNAGGRLVAWCDEETAQNAPPDSLHLPFKLSASGETLTLTAPDGTVVDQVTFGPQVADISQGRSPDGSSTIDFLDSPTAGTANAPSLPTPQLATVELTEGVVGITLATTPGFIYQFQVKESLTDPVWLNDGPPVVASGTTLTLSSSPTTASRRFYRVLRLP